MAKIIITPRPLFQQRLRRCTLYIDGIKTGEILKGNANEFIIPAGVHNAQCKMSWYSSNIFQISVNENDVKFLQVQSNMPYFWVFYILFLGSLLAPMVMRVMDVEKPENFNVIQTVILVIVALYFLFFSFIKRKTYLRISEDTKNIFNT
jgi:hypothetical protein